MYEKLITVIIMLFILSMISERLVTFFKLWCVKGNSFLFIIVSKELDTSIKSNDKEEENKREQAILAINLTISLCIALISKASLFNMFTYSNSTDLKFLLGWNFSRTFDIVEFIQILVGCALTACFISLGSKFWHDMLDMLFYAKNLKEKLVDKATYEMSNLKQIEDWISLSENEIIKKVFNDNLDYLKNIKDVIAVGIGQDARNKYIEITTTSNNHSEIPSYLTYQLPNNTIRNYPVKIITSSTIVTHGNLSFKSDITNQGRLSNYGSFGLAVKFKNGSSNHKMLLTCYHVIIGHGDDFYSFKYTERDEIVSPYYDEDATVGRVRQAIRNDRIDAAIIDIDNNISISNILPNGSIINDIRVINNEELYKGIPVRIYGYKSNSDTGMGIIDSLHNYVNIEYTLPNGRKQNWGLYDLISVSNYGSAISQEGDSGSALLDENNNVIGIVVGGNDYSTYAIPIETIFNQLNLELL
ncbi:hypothetical protein FIA58_004645 [Flavobacterium jejuense]|uniref:Peptidase S1 domain-containing protein n=1 Tax=Flavobacterium jejuense TaxID=1544455 RepID=A0ABX0IT15_9FLAO|nr:hypothetical protein [Flavobacterium jejuense]NHN24960.1 hypothetical protein [Flavobacterium jejuense]